MQLLDQSDAGQPAHVVVGHQEVIAVTLESVPGESAIFSGVHVVAGVKQHFGAESADVRLVIHHKNALGWICPASDRRTADSIKRNSKKPAHRSEEHTSELQSLRHLVCRLLLEKKK